MAVLVPGVVAELSEGVVALRAHTTGVKRLDTTGMLSLRGVKVSATVNSSGWGPLFCMKNEMVVVRVRVIAERLERRGEFQVGEVVGVVCRIA